MKPHAAGSQPTQSGAGDRQKCPDFQEVNQVNQPVPLEPRHLTAPRILSARGTCYSTSATLVAIRTSHDPFALGGWVHMPDRTPTASTARGVPASRGVLPALLLL